MLTETAPASPDASSTWPERRDEHRRRPRRAPHRRAPATRADPSLLAALRWEVAQARRPAPRPAVLLGARAGADRWSSWSSTASAPAEGHPVRPATSTTTASPSPLLVLGFAAQWVLPLLTAHRRRRHLRQRGPARHLEDGPHPLGQPRPSSSGPRPSPRSASPSLVAGRCSRARTIVSQPADRRPPAADRPDRPDSSPPAPPLRLVVAELGRPRSPPTARLHLPGDPAVGLVAQPGRRHRRPGRDRHGHAARRQRSAASRPSARFLLTTPFEAWHGLLDRAPGSRRRSSRAWSISAGWCVGLPRHRAVRRCRRRDITGG